MSMLILALLALAPVPQAAQAQAPAARTIEVTGGDNMKFSVPRITARRGETLRIVLTVVSKMPKAVMSHNLVVLQQGVNAAAFNAAAVAARDWNFIPQDRKNEIVAYTQLAGNGETVEVTFTVPDKAGNYDFICTFPGHYNLGMKGAMVVK